MVLVSHMSCNPYQLYFTLPEMYSSQICVTENIQFISKHPIVMNSVFPGTNSTSYLLCYKFHMLWMHSIPQLGLCTVYIFSRKPSLIKFFSLGPCQMFQAQDKYVLSHGNLRKHKEGHAKWKNPWAQSQKHGIDQ
jgi:hypothetical protein